jgi:hypothetical protein
MNLLHVKTNTVADFTGTVTVYNQTGGSQTLAATDLVRPSDWNSQHKLFFTYHGNTTGNSTLSGLTLPIAGAGGVSVGGSNGSFVISGMSDPGWLTTAALSGHSHNLATTTTGGASIVVGTANSNGYTIGVPAFLTTAQPVGAYLTTARASNDAIGLNSALTANGVSVTANSSGLSLNFPAFLTTAAQSNHSHGNPTLALTNLTGTTASNSAGFTLSLSGAGGGVINQTGPNIADSAATITSGTVLFNNANGISFGLNGSTMTASHNALTTAAQSNHSHGNPTLALTNLTGTTASESNGFTLSLSAAAPGAGGGVAVSAGTTSTNNTTVSFADNNGISFGLNGYILTASHNGLTTAALSNHSHGNPTLALTNLTGTTASASNGFTLSLSAANPGAGGGVAPAAGTQTQTSGTVLFQNSNNITFGMSNSSVITASFNPINIGMSTNGNTAGTTGTYDGAGLQYVLIGGNNITLSQSANGSSVSLSIVGPAPGGGATMDYWHNFGVWTINSTNQPYQSTFNVIPIILPEAIAMDHFRFCQSIPALVSTTFASTANTSFSYNQQMTQRWVLYTRGTGTNNTNLYSIASGENVNTFSFALSAGASTSTPQTQSLGFSWINKDGGTSTASTSGSSASSVLALRGSAIWTNLSGDKYDYIPYVTTLTAGNYWLAFNTSTTQTTHVLANAAAHRLYPTMGAIGQFNRQINPMVGGSNSSNQAMLGLGSATTVGGATIPTLPLSAISTSASHVIPLFYIGKGL